MNQRMKFVLLCGLLACLVCGCGSLPGEIIQNLSSSSSYFDNYSSRGSWQKRMLKGTVHQMKNTDNAVLIRVEAEEASTVTVKGSLKRVDGEIRLVYTQDDGTETLIASGDEKNLDTEIEIPKGSGTIHFAGSDEDAVYGFELTFRGHGDVDFVDDAALEREMEDNLPEIVEGIPEAEENWELDADGIAPYTGWQNGVSKINDGMTANRFSMELPIYETADLSISCVTESGRMDMSITDADGNVYFSEVDIQTGNYKTKSVEPGTYLIIIQADQHRGSFSVKPAKTGGEEGYYHNFHTESTKNHYKISGTIHQNSRERGMIRFEAAPGTEITIKGYIKREEGDIRLVYEDQDGSILLLAQGGAESDETVKIDTSVKVKLGEGRIYFTGWPAVYEFELELGPSEEVRYYLE